MACHSLGRDTFQERNSIDFEAIQIKCLEEFIASKTIG